MMLKTYSDDEGFLSSLIEFASADRTGSTYALWLRNGNTDLNNAPVIIFGSEGGYHVVAENVRQLLQLLTYDTEPLASWDRVFYYKNEQDHQPSEYIDQYRQWAFDQYQITVLADPKPGIQQAQEKYQDEFREWMQQYIGS